MTKEQLINRRVSKGANRAQSVALLEELINAHDGDNLAYVLVYEGYATEKQAYKFINN